MNYQNPQLLYFLFALSIPIIIHLFNFRKHKNIYFSSIRFLKQIRKQSSTKSKIKNILLLTTRILAISFLIFAFSNPYLIKNEKNNNDDVFIYIDNSYSMDANNLHGRAIDIAKNTASKIISNYPKSSNFFLITNDFLNHKSFNKIDIENKINEIQTSYSIKNFKEIIDRLKTMTSKNSDLYIISDMQKSTTQLNKLSVDSNINLFIVPIEIEKPPNLSIDSCWIENPVLSNEEVIELNFIITNHSDMNINDVVVYLNIDKEQKSQQYIDIQPKSTIRKKFNFKTDFKNIIQGNLNINDYPISFDNKLYFTLKKNFKINISCIGYNENNSLNYIFKNDSNIFNFKYYNINNLKIANISNQDLIILNEITEINSGLLSTLEDLKSNYGSIVIIPPSKLNISSYNIMLENLGVSTIIDLHEDTLNINWLNTNHSLFKNVFNDDISNINYPKVKKYYTINDNKNTIPLIKLENNKSFLNVYYHNNSAIYQFLTPINTNFSNFQKHALMVPTFFNIATQSIRTESLYNIIDNNIFTTSFKNKSNTLLHLKNDKIDIVTEKKIFEGKEYYYTNNLINENGIYSLTIKDSIADKVAFNYNRIESDLITLNNNEIKDIINKNNIYNISIISEDNLNTSYGIINQTNNHLMWKLALILSLLFFAIEIFLIKIKKI